MKESPPLRILDAQLRYVLDDEPPGPTCTLYTGSAWPFALRCVRCTGPSFARESQRQIAPVYLVPPGSLCDPPVAYGCTQSSTVIY